jgi:hypothetical protein
MYTVDRIETNAHVEGGGGNEKIKIKMMIDEERSEGTECWCYNLTELIWLNVKVNVKIEMNDDE